MFPWCPTLRSCWQGSLGATAEPLEDTMACEGPHSLQQLLPVLLMPCCQTQHKSSSLSPHTLPPLSGTLNCRLAASSALPRRTEQGVSLEGLPGTSWSCLALAGEKHQEEAAPKARAGHQLPWPVRCYRRDGTHVGSMRKVFPLIRVHLFLPLNASISIILESCNGTDTRQQKPRICAPCSQR